MKRHKCDGTYGQSKVKKIRNETGVDDSLKETSILDEQDEEFFKNCLAIEQEQAIKERLLKTLEIRKTIFSSSVQIFENFQFFFYNPQLVILYRIVWIF